MKNLIMFLIIVLLAGIRPISGIASPDDAQQEKDQLVAILNALDGFFTGNLNDTVTRRYVLVRDKIRSKELVFRIDPSMPRDIFEGIGFRFYASEDARAEIALSPFILNVYKKKPSIVYSALLHEFNHAYDYFTNKNAYVYWSGNVLEQYMYELDSIAVEIEFIKNYLLPRAFALVEYERYLLASFERDRLHSISVEMKGYDYALAHHFYDVRVSGISPKEKIAVLARTGEKILKSVSIPTKGSDDEKYRSIAVYYTYCSMISQVVYDITVVDLKQKLRPEDFSLKTHAPLDDIKRKMDAVVSKHLKWYDNYSKSLRNAYVIKG